VRGVDEIRALAQLGYRAALVGSALMQSSEPVAAVARLIAAGTERLAEMRACS
jgi:indole-3-glycerol phosphate synthase